MLNSTSGHGLPQSLRGRKQTAKRASSLAVNTNYHVPHNGNAPPPPSRRVEVDRSRSPRARAEPVKDWGVAVCVSEHWRGSSNTKTSRCHPIRCPGQDMIQSVRAAQPPSKHTQHAAACKATRRTTRSPQHAGCTLPPLTAVRTGKSPVGRLARRLVLDRLLACFGPLRCPSPFALAVPTTCHISSQDSGELQRQQPVSKASLGAV